MSEIFKKHWWVLPLGLFLLLAAVFHFSSPNVPDIDSFFYIRQAWHYRTDGLFNSDFPWIYFSVIRKFSASLWYGFGIFLIPFTFFSNLILGIKLAGILLTAGVLFSCCLVIRRHQLKMPVFWPLLIFFSAPNVLFQMLMTRPQTASFVLIPLLFSFLLTGNFWGIALTTFGISWIHFNFAWMPFLFLLIVFGAKLLINKTMDWKSILAIFGGSLLGWLLRPNPLGALKLFYIQVFQQILEKQSGLPLLFGKENFPLTAGTLLNNFLVFLLLWFAAILIFIWALAGKNPSLTNERKNFLLSGGVLSLIFFLFTMIIARRVYNLWVIMGVIFLAGVFGYLLENRIKNMAKYILAIAFVFLIFFSGYKNSISLAQGAHQPNKFKEVGLWLTEHSSPGDVVFNLHWPDFSPLYFWDQKNYYVGGLDPIFQYSYNPNLYWKFHYLSADQVTKKTCGAPACTLAMLEDTHDVLVKDFNAKYIVLNKQQNPAVNSFLENDPRFDKKLDTRDGTIYLVK